MICSSSHADGPGNYAGGGLRNLPAVVVGKALVGAVPPEAYVCTVTRPGTSVTTPGR